MPKRNASARWEGSLQEGNGTMRMGSGSYEGPYSFQSRFEEGDGTNPEELIAAAHAGCFSMALSGELGRAGHEVESVDTEATVHLEKVDGGFAIKRIELRTRVTAPGLDDSDFQQAAEAAKRGCPISQALAAVETIDLDAQLTG
ncbi:MAG TPA: OsmC family protein [Thermoleophilaceae bacterium]|jgi:osmotically inducible protein OsmC|nr:OsmC family protein [Thermoleophilaceae bacterium]